MFTLYSIAMPAATATKVKEHSSYGELKKFMNSMKQANKSTLYAIYDEAGRVKTSMLNK
jgi:hypothetical protein